MSKAIAFLETMGQDADLRRAGRSALYHKLTERQIDADVQWAILRGDASRLGFLLGATTNICCPLNPAKENDEEEPAQDDDEITMQSAIRVVAAAA